MLTLSLNFSGAIGRCLVEVSQIEFSYSHHTATSISLLLHQVDVI